MTEAESVEENKKRPGAGMRMVLYEGNETNLAHRMRYNSTYIFSVRFEDSNVYSLMK